MARSIHYLGWDEPLASRAAEYIVGSRKGRNAVDLDGTIIIAPTLQAGRRLREVMTLHCAQQDAAMLSAMIVTPNHFFSTSAPDPKTATPSLARIVWAKVLTSTDLSGYKHLFPGKTMHRNDDKFAWSLTTGETVDKLRQELADGGYTIGSVVTTHGEDLEELERWQDLAALEDLFITELKALGMEDACMAKMRRAANPQVDASVKRIVVVAVPDPSLLAIQSLAKLAETIPVEVLVYAPDKMKDRFDEWGRPVPEQWAKMNVEVPDWSDNVYVETSPSSQSRRAKKIIESDTSFGPADVTIGVPDRSLIPFLQNELLSLDMPAFDPSDIAFETNTLSRLIEYLLNMLLVPTYESVAALLRHPAYLRYMDEKHGVNTLDLLTRLDEFQNFYLPPTFERMLDLFKNNSKGSIEHHNDFTLLGKALTVINNHITTLKNEPFEHSWRKVLKDIYETHKLDPAATDDRDFENAAAVVEETLRELRDIPGTLMKLTNTQISSIFMRRLTEQSFHRERNNEVVDLQGWLELPWSDAPFMVVTGMNEDFVPGGSLSDAFLPDSLRVKLNLRHDLLRFGRDVYLMLCMIESRRKKGRICFITGKAGMNGDPLKPSRLMFRCDDKELPARAALFFGEKRDEVSRPGTEVLFRLNPAVAAEDCPEPDVKKINVTSFSAYLDCPFRFYLKYMLGMQELDDGKTGVDSLDFGSIVHSVLEEMGREKKLWACTDADELAKHLKQLASQYITVRFGSPLPLSVQVSLESAIQRMNALAACQARLVGEGWKVIAVEEWKKNFKYHRGFLVTGKIDRIDRNDKTGKIRILDYKTSDNPVDPEDAHIATLNDETPEYNRLTVPSRGGKTAVKRWSNLQLPLYHLLYTDKEVLDRNIELAYFNLPKAVSATGVKAWDSFSPEMMASAITCIKGVIEAIDNGVFWPPSENVAHDDFERLFIHSADDTFETKGLFKKKSR